ncbi:unnamed protein product [Darwinula stevensoni]|uniref:Uncharacterized protein n=1 Tax=Darwinula stevensoni TaxID=69355 RepID=A0A7R8XDX4_9CRUS|nr:unnamed protein product [Darwinula stevensoni]CAG0893939.1 unnamed protein product [Darwinula stevensoni]
MCSTSIRISRGSALDDLLQTEIPHERKLTLSTGKVNSLGRQSRGVPIQSENSVFRVRNDCFDFHLEEPTEMARDRSGLEGGRPKLPTQGFQRSSCVCSRARYNVVVLQHDDA